MRVYHWRRLLPALVLLEAGTVRADYALPEVQERHVLLLEAAQLSLSPEDAPAPVLEIRAGEKKISLAVSAFWMQDRIWSGGLCVGVAKDDPRSAERRIAALREHLSGSAPPPPGCDVPAAPLPVLVEVVETKGGELLVAYLEKFDAEGQFPRYCDADPAGDGKAFRVKPGIESDRIALDWKGTFEGPAAFEGALRVLTEDSLKPLLARAGEEAAPAEAVERAAVTRERAGDSGEEKGDKIPPAAVPP